MAAALKTSKPDLVAIHRLEFYKKQKNWKFCTIERRKDEEKKKAAKNTKRVTLNKTYSIETVPEDSNDVKTKTEEVQLKEQDNSHMESQDMQEADRSPTEEKVDHLNEAFVDTENDDNVPALADKPRQPIGPYNPKWSVQQWAEHCQLWNSDPTPSVQTDPNFVSYDPKHHVQDDPNYAPCGRNHVQNDLNCYLQCGPMQYVHNDPNYVPCAPENHIQNDLSSQYCLQSDFNQPHLVQDCMNQPCQALRKPTQQCCIENSMIHNQVTEYETELLYKRRDPLHSGTNLPHGALMDMKFREREQSASCDGQGWSRQTQVWSNKQTGWFEEINDIPQEAIEAMEALEVGDGDAVDGGARGAGDWLQASKGQGLPRSDSLPSVSSESFSRGAALAPHSTAMDVSAMTETIPTVMGTPGTVAGTLEGIKGTSGTLPAPALAAAVVGHAAALAALLSEARRRDIQVAPPPVQPLYNFKEYPSRDVGFSPHTHDYPPPPYTPAPSSVYTHNPTTVHDIFVAGSFNNRPDMCGQTEGRGRGRQNRVIAIEKGRPYRLK